MFEYIMADTELLEKIWDYNIASNPNDIRWLRWKEEYIGYNTRGMAKTFLVVHDGEAVGEGTLIISPDCSAVRGRYELADGKNTANVNALRIRKEFEGMGHISRLMRELEKYAADCGCTRLTIGVEAKETRNLAIYLHWGYDSFVTAETEDGEFILYYAKDIAKQNR